MMKMTKDEMKNKISMELKNPITQQGFEIICKNLAELEKEISNLLSCKDCPDNRGGYICDKEYSDRCLCQKIQYIKELKEEITTLEKENAKAKEMIKELLSYDCILIDATRKFEYMDLQRRIENFIALR